MSGLFVSLSIGNAWEKISSFLRGFSAAPSSSSSVRQEDDDLEELRKMERTMLRIRAMLHDAEEHWNIREESAKLRLKELKDVAYDMEDVVDEYEYEVNRRKLEVLDRSDSDKTTTGKRKYQEENEEYLKDTGVVPVPKELILQARKITERFDEIIRYSKYLSITENDGERRFVPDISSFRQTSSIVVEKSIHGRDQVKETIVQELLSTEREDAASPVSVMAIVGMGGVGKTTLAQLVHNDKRVKQSFDKLVWLCVSENFEVNKLTRNIIPSIMDHQSEYTELADLQQELASGLKDKRIFMVLDDVWNERRDCWELFCRPMSTAKICQIVVTTRNMEVARLVQAMRCHRLECLNFDESWTLFCQAPFVVAKEYDIPTNLIRIGKRIVEKCNGLPLAVKTIGSMLRYETDEREWEDVLENKLWDFEQPRNEVLPALELSYNHMPVYLRRCFISLSLFPKAFMITKDRLFQIWERLDMLHGNSHENKIREKYLSELVERSMLQIYSQHHDEFLMHDLIHDLASFLAGEEFYRLDGNALPQIPQNVRYLSINSSSFTIHSVEHHLKFHDISHFPPSLRVIVVIMDSLVIETTLPESLFSMCKKLRALDICINRSLIKALPYMRNLKLLRHLSYAYPFLRSWKPRFQNILLNGIGNLINLHTLPIIDITRCPCRFNIKRLRNINKIWELSINGLNNISCIEDAKDAQLKRKEHLRALYLDFADTNHNCSCGLQPETVTKLPHDQLLHSLRPHCNLRKLIIQNYDSGIYPSWLGNPSFSKLTSINFGHSISKHLPVLGGLPFLKELSIVGMHSVEHIGHDFSCKGFPSLTNLVFEEMSKWSGWSGVDAGDFPSLNSHALYHCPKLRYLPLGQLGPLKSLILYYCDSFATFPEPPVLHELRIEECTDPNELPMRSSLLTMEILPNLTTLELTWCPNISVVHYLPKLITLELKYCPNISAVHYLPSLSTLTIEDCQNISAVRYLPSLTTLTILGLIDETVYRLLNLPSLKSLRICIFSHYLEKNKTVTCIPLQQKSLPALTRLHLINYPDLQYCDGLASLTSLKHLEVRGCPKLPIYNLIPPQLETSIIEDEEYEEDKEGTPSSPGP